MMGDPTTFEFWGIPVKNPVFLYDEIYGHRLRNHLVFPMRGNSRIYTWDGEVDDFHPGKDAYWVRWDYFDYADEFAGDGSFTFYKNKDDAINRINCLFEV